MMLCTPEALDSNQRSAVSGQQEGITSTKTSLLRSENRQPRAIPAVSFVTNHVALADVPKHLSVERIVEVIRITATGPDPLRYLRTEACRCGVKPARR